MTLTETRKEYARLAAMDKAFYVATDVALIVERDPAAIRAQAHEAPHKLGFPVVVTGRHVTIPRAAFLDYIERNVLGLRQSQLRPQRSIDCGELEPF